MHKFSSRYVPIEPHVYVPLASVINKYWWLVIWAFLGIRNNFQKGMSFDEVAKKNFKYLRNRTNYLPKKELRQQLNKHFKSYMFREDLFIKHTLKLRFLHIISTILPFIPLLYSMLYCRVVLLKNENKEV